MSPPDTNLKKQKRRHRGPLIGIGVVSVLGVALILYWIVELFVTAPTVDEHGKSTTPAEYREGDVEVPDDAPTQTMAPDDPEVEVEN